MKNNINISLVLIFLHIALILLPDANAENAAENFYTWANKEWLEDTEIAPDMPRADNFSAIEEKVNTQIKDLIEELKDKEARTPEEEKLVRLYDSFVDMDQRDDKGISPIAEDLAKIDALKTHLDLAKLFAYYQSIGITTPMKISAQTDFKDSSFNIAVVEQEGLGIDRDYYLGKDDNSLKQQKLYKTFLTKLFKLASISNPEASADRVLELERKLAEIQWSQIENRDSEKVYNPTTFKAFAKVSSDFYAEEIMKDLKVPNNVKLCIAQPSYFKKYSSLYRSTPLSTWQDYARARLLNTYSVLLTSEFKAVQAQYQKDLGLIQEEEELWKQGIKFASDNANMILGRAYVEKYFDKKIKTDVTELVHSIRDSYRSSIEQAPWMSKETKKKAIDKLEKMQFKIGYPDQWIDYSGLEIPGTVLAENYKSVKLFEQQRDSAKFGHPVNRNEWEHSPHDVNASYNPTSNEFVILAAILQKPLYSEKASAAMKYGSLGFIVGHEIGHGFDDQGSRFDGVGNLVNWWNKTDLKAYNEKRQKLIDQANAYEILPGVYLKGEQEIGEIMGDLSGAQIAFRAYKKTAGASDRAFFIQLAKTWRSKWRDEFLLMVLHKDVHPPSEFRSNGIVIQFEEFYKAFKIKPGDKMYLAPEKRILMW